MLSNMLSIYYVINILCYQYIMLSIYYVINILCYQYIMLSICYVILTYALYANTQYIHVLGLGFKLFTL